MSKSIDFLLKMCYTINVSERNMRVRLRRNGMITLDRFEEVLKAKYHNGIHTFTGNRTHNVYRIHNNGKTKGLTLWVNQMAVKINTNFFVIADEIYDREVR